VIDKLVPFGHHMLEKLPKGDAMSGAVQRTWERLLTVRPSGPAWFEAFGLAALNWTENCGCLVACIWAVHGHIPWHGILVAYALAQVLASVPITPGGLGVVEGGLTALLVAYGMPTNVALASVLLYRAVSFWGLVPVGWGVWGYLSYQSRRPQHKQVRPHPWAVHLHRQKDAVETPPRSAPDIVLPAQPCEGCPEHPDERVNDQETVSVP
jgi:hypothetical protein